MPGAGPGITASAEGKVSSNAPLPEDVEAAEAPTLVPGTVRVAPDRSPFRTIEPLATPLDSIKTKGVWGANPELTPLMERAADVNGDGTDDLVTAIMLNNGGTLRAYLAVMLGIGDGTYTDPIFSLGAPTGTNGSTPYDMALADVDGDGALDAILSTTNYSTGALSLALGVGDGSFAAPIGSLAVANPGFLRVGEWGGTADVQIAVTGSGGTIHVLDVNPEGFDDLTPAGVGWLNSNRRVNAIEAADVDGDGQSELYLAMDSGVTDTEGIQRLTDLTGASPSKTWVEGVKPPVYRMAFADIDGDTKLDLTVSERRPVGYGAQYWVRTVALPGRDPGADPFPTGVQLLPSESYCPDRMDAARLKTADMDHDGDLDLVMLNCQWGELNYLRVALNDGDGGYTLSHWVATPGENGKDPVAGLNRNPRSIAIVDANSDDLPDVAWTGSDDGVANGVTVVLGNIGHPGELVAPPLLDAGGVLTRNQSWNAQQVLIADWNEDGSEDLVVMRDNDIVWREGDGTGRFGPPEVITSRTASTWCAAGAGELGAFDLDDDGHLDLVCHTPGKLGMAWGGGEGVALVATPLETVPDYQNWNGYHGIDAPDLDGDGKLDLVIPVFTSDFDAGSNGYVFFQGDDREWPADPAIALMGSATTLAVGNVDSDPEPELVAMPDRRRQSTSTADLFDRVISWSADGSGGLTEHISAATSSRVVGGLGGTIDNGHGLGDFDGDGILDLVTIWYYGNPYYQQRLLVRKGLGNGEFAANGDAYATSMNWNGGSYQRQGSSIGVRDMDGDGNLDIVYESTSFGVEILPGKGDGTFDDQRFGRWPAGNNNGTIAIGDVDGDHKPDIVAGNDMVWPDGPQLSHTLLLNRSVANADAPANLAVTDVSAPASVGAGDQVAVQVTVTNTGGDISAATKWKDGAWLSETAGYSLDATEIAVTPRQGPLAAGASYTVTLTGPAKAFKAGAHQLVVRTDLGLAVTEPDEVDNTTTRPIAITAPVLTPGGAPISVTVADGASRLVRIPAVAGRNVSITATPATANAVRGRAGADRAPKLGAGTQLRPTGTGPLVGAVSRGTDGDLYALIEGLSAASSGVSVQLSADDAAVGIYTSSPGRVANAGDVTLTLTGSGLDGAAMQLLPRAGANGNAVDATKVRAGGTPGTWFATFPLTSQLGSFDLKASGPGGDAVLPSAVVIESPVTTPNTKEFEVSVSVPGAIRRHVPAGGGLEIRPGYSGHIVLRNRTGRDLPAPFVRMEAEGIDVAWPSVVDGERSVLVTAEPGEVPVLTMLGTLLGGPVDTIPARATITIDFRLWATASDAFSAQVGVWAASDQSGELDHSTEAAGLASAYDLPASAAAKIDEAMDAAMSHPAKPSYTGASSAGPWPTPGGFTLALDRMAAMLDENGRDAGSVEEVRSLVVHSALGAADIGAPISGSLVEDGHAPGEPLEVAATPIDGSGPVLVGYAAPDGRFNLLAPQGSEAASAEAYRISVDRRIASATVTLTPGTPISGVDVEVDRGIAAIGRITASSDGAPVGRAQIVLTPEPGSGEAPLGTTARADGTFRTDGLVAGAVYHLSVRSSDFATLIDEAVTVPASGVLALDRSLAPGFAVTGTVTGAGAGGAEVSARDSEGTVRAAVAAEGDGTYRLDGLPAGSFDLLAVAAEGASAHASVTVAGPATRDLVLQAGVVISGIVTDATSGDPVEGAQVQLTADGTGTVLAPVVTAADGSFAVPQVPRGPVQVFASGSEGRMSPTQTVDAATAGTGIELVIGGGRHVSGTVTDQGGDPVAGAVVEVRPQTAGADGEPDVLAGESAITGSDGRYSAVVMDPGTYDVETIGDHGQAVLADGAPDPVVDLQTTAAAVSGSVSALEGGPAAGVPVTFYDGEELLAEMVTGDDGTFRVAVAGGKQLDLWVSAPTVGVDHAAVDVAASGTTSVGSLGAEAGSVAVSVTGMPSGTSGSATLVPRVADEHPAAGPRSSIDLVGSSASFAGLAPGSYDLLVQGDGFVAATQEVTVDGAETASVAAVAAADYSSLIVDEDGAPVPQAVVSALSADGGGWSRVSVTGEDGAFTLRSLPAGLYDIWVTSASGIAQLVASSLPLGPEPAAAVAPGEASADAITSAEPHGGLPAEFPYNSTPSGSAVTGHIVGANGAGLGAVPPSVNVRRENQSVPVVVQPDGSFSLEGATDGDLVIEITKPGYTTQRYPVNIPGDNGKSLTLEMGVPEAVVDKLTDIHAPYTPSVWETFTALFTFTKLPNRVSDYRLQPLLSGLPPSRCPSGVELWKRAQAAARAAVSQNEMYNALTDVEYKERWTNALLFATRVADFVNTVVATFLPLARGAEVAFAGGRRILITIPKGDISKASDFVRLMDDLAAVPFASIASDFVSYAIGAYIQSSVDFNPKLFIQKAAIDAFMFKLKTGIRDLEWIGLAAGERTLTAFLGLVSVISNINDLVFDKGPAIVNDLKDGYALLKGAKEGREEQLRQIEKLEKMALFLWDAWLAQQNGRADCDEPKDLPRYDGGVGGAVDPNEIVGPTGTGADKWLAVPAGLGYEIHFENLGPGTENPPPGVPLATAPAAYVEVTETVPSTFDRSSFAFDDLGWGGHVIDVPDGAQSFEIDEPITVPVEGGTSDLVVRVAGDFDPSTGKATWTYTTLDPETGQIPLDPAEGFLPPEPGDESGQGWARYSVSGAEGVAQGTYLDAKAEIVFDTNDPIDTNTWRNRVGSPTSTTDVCPETDTDDGHFVCAAYEDINGRTADASGKAYWLNKLAQGTSRTGMARQVLASTEARRHAVTQTFDHYLGRAPDAAGSAYWVGKLGSGTSRDQLRRSVIASAEYWRGHGSTNTGFVDGLYQDIYGRSADAPGKQHWVKALTDGKERGSAAAAFLEAKEGRRALVRSVYGDYLSRSLSFDEAQYWADRIARQRDERRFRSEVIGSAEYYRHAGPG